MTSQSSPNLYHQEEYEDEDHTVTTTMSDPALSDEEALRFLFDTFDSNKNGMMEREEMRVMVQALQHPPHGKEFKHALPSAAIGFDAFKIWLGPHRRSVQRMADLFSRYDKDNSGSISRKELEAMLYHLRIDTEDQQIAEIVRQSVEESHGEIDFRAFIRSSSLCFMRCSPDTDPVEETPWIDPDEPKKKKKRRKTKRPNFLNYPIVSEWRSVNTAPKRLSHEEREMLNNQMVRKARKSSFMYRSKSIGCM